MTPDSKPGSGSRDLELPEMLSIPAGLARIGTTLEGVEACVLDWNDKLVDPSYEIERFREWILKEYPQHEVRLNAYSIARLPVTNREYARMLNDAREQTQKPPESIKRSEPDDHPVWGVSVEDAQAYVAWLSRATGKRFRLPSEEEWEHAARGPSGRQYPFGERFDPRCCNTAEAGIGRSTPVDAYAAFASEFGVVDMAGNVEEWTSTLYEPYPGGRLIHDDLSRGPYGIKYPVLRGGSFSRGGDLARCARRHGPKPGVEFRYTGIRVASDD